MLLVPLPPPAHGSNLMNYYLIKCIQSNNNFCHVIQELHYANNISDIGTIKISKLFKALRYIFLSILHIRSFKPHIIYFVPALTGIAFLRDFFFSSILKFCHPVVIYHLHGKGISTNRSKLLYNVIYKRFFRNTYIIQLSKLLFYDIKKYVHRRSCFFIPNGIPGPHFRPETQNTVASKYPTILFLSNLIPAKGPLVLLEACRILKDKGIEFSAHFVGNPSKEISSTFFEMAIRNYGLENFAKYLGPKYGEEKHEELRHADILAFPTEKDCFPLVLLEAMAHYLPVVATNEGAIPQIVQDGRTGFIIRKNNPLDLAEKLEILINSPEIAKKMGLLGYFKFSNMYTMDHFCNNIVITFQHIYNLHY